MDSTFPGIVYERRPNPAAPVTLYQSSGRLGRINIIQTMGML